MRFKKLTAFTLTGAMSLSLAACGGDGDDTASPAPNTRSPSAAADTPVPEGEVYKIGVLAPKVTHGWSAGVAHYAEKRCDELVAEGKIEKKILISGDAAEMTTQLDELKTWSTDAIVAFPQWEGMKVPIQQAINEGITVVDFGIAIGADGVYRVSGDNYDMGYQSTQYTMDKIGTEGTVVIPDIPTSGSAAELRKQGFTGHVAELTPNMNLVGYATKFTHEAGLVDVADILTANSQIGAVFFMDDGISIGVLQAIRGAGRTDIKIIIDGSDAQEWFNMMLANENQDIWLQSALYSPDMVEDVMDMVLGILNGDAPENPVKIILTIILDRDTVESHLNENSPY